MKNKNVVTIGGGTGSFMLLSGLKKYPINLSAIVSMADDGGSTGMLRDELGVLPPGDVRQCLVALSDSPENLRELMNYRFDKGRLNGHSFGNLFLSALEKIKSSFSGAVEEASKILNIKGDVIPVSEDDMRLKVILKNGRILEGESQLDHNKKVRSIGVNRIVLKNSVKASQKAIDRIKKADFIIIGPGDHFGSIIPNLLIKGIREAIEKSKAKVIYNCKLTNKKGQNENFDLDDYVESIEKYIGKNKVDFVTYNTKQPPKYLLDKYKRREGNKVIVDFNEGKRKDRSFKLVKADLLNEKGFKKNRGDNNTLARSFIRHDSEKLGKVLSIIIEMDDYYNIIKNII
jgi:uncharacterized cofD-like protein